MKIGFVSLGCSKNLVDSEMMMGFLLSNNHQLVDDPSQAEAIIINTCGFINSAKEESINTILEMAEYKQDKCRYLIVTGCLAQRYLSDLEKDLPEVDRFITIDEYDNLASIFATLFKMPFKSYGKEARVISTKPWTAYLKIAEGCSNRCAYCAIPLIRKAFRSYPLDDLVSEAKHLASLGVKELVLIAQDTTRYGLDIGIDLVTLLKELNKIENINWIRILYMYPDEITKDLISGMKKLDKVLPYFDIPIQHGSDRMLKIMNRRGSIDMIKATIATIRNTFSLVALRTTLIVGFPSETEEDIIMMKDVISDIGFDRLGVFTYSHEENTDAYKMKDDVSEEEKAERLRLIVEHQQLIVNYNNQRLIDQTLEVLIEGYDAIKKVYRGRSLFSAPDNVDGVVYVKSENKTLEMGAFYQVLIKQANAYDMSGVITE